jgi:hypothetical protein
MLDAAMAVQPTARAAAHTGEVEFETAVHHPPTPALHVLDTTSIACCSSALGAELHDFGSGIESVGTCSGAA